MLSSTGKYSGVLERIEVQGETETPDFSIDTSGQPVSLQDELSRGGGRHQRRHLSRSRSTLASAKRSSSQGGGGSSRGCQRPARRSRCRDRGGAHRGRPAAGGERPGPDHDRADAVWRRRSFCLPATATSSTNWSCRARSISTQRTFRQDGHSAAHQRAQSARARAIGRRGTSSVVSKLSGRFTLRRGTAQFHEFIVRRSRRGRSACRDVRPQTRVLDFAGDLLLDASLSQTTTGMEIRAARLAQPFFRRRGGGSKLPIKVTGPRRSRSSVWTSSSCSRSRKPIGSAVVPRSSDERGRAGSL